MVWGYVRRNTRMRSYTHTHTHTHARTSQQGVRGSLGKTRFIIFHYKCNKKNCVSIWKKKLCCVQFFETALLAVLISSLINKSIRINSGPNILRSCFLHWTRLKPPRRVFLRCQLRNFENGTLVAHRREHFRGLLTSLKKRQGWSPVATRVVTGISHWIVLFCERYWLAGVWCAYYVWWRTLFLINYFGIELVLCELYLTMCDSDQGFAF